MQFRNLAHGLGVLAIAGFGAVGGNAAEPVESKPLFSRWKNPFAETPKTAMPAAELKTASAMGPVVPRPVTGPLSAETFSAVLKEEQAAYTRRLEVCMQLRKVAFESSNDALSLQADELERLAELTYKTRIARIGMKSNFRNNSGAEDLERSVGSAMKSTPLASGVQSPAEIRPATAQLKNQFREVKP